MFRRLSHQKQPVEVVGDIITVDSNGDACIRSCGETSISGGRALSIDFAEITVNDSTWTSVTSSFTNILQVSVQNKTGFQLKLNPNQPVGMYIGMVLEDDEERNYNDVDDSSGFAQYARLAPGSGSATIFVEVLRNA